jgi:hypothetical protein
LRDSRSLLELTCHRPTAEFYYNLRDRGVNEVGKNARAQPDGTDRYHGPPNDLRGGSYDAHHRALGIFTPMKSRPSQKFN